MSSTEAAQLALLDELSNTGRWGADDELGTLNHVTPAVRAAAAALVRSGRTVSCSRLLRPDVQPYAVGATAAQRYMVRSGEGDAGAAPAAGASEFVGMVFHGRWVTHLDALAHVFAGGRLYNDVPAARVTTASGAQVHAVTAAEHGIVTRGVLVDVARHRGVTALPAGEGVEADEVETVLAAQGATVGAGDAVLLRTGHGGEVSRWQRGDPPLTGYAGWAPSCLRWFRERDVAVVGADTPQDPVPALPGALVSPVHIVGIVAMGLWLLDNCDLEALGTAAAEEGRWEFQFVIAPLRLAGGTGSPVNPIAVF